MSTGTPSNADVDIRAHDSGRGPVSRRMRAASAVLVVQAVAEVVWTLRLISIVDLDSKMLAAAVGIGSVIGVTVLACLVHRGRVRTPAALVEVAILGGSVDWLMVFPRLRAETAATMAVGAVGLVLLADRSTQSPRRHGESS